MTDMWQPVQPHGALPSRIADQIEELIATHQLQPGTRLPPERELAALLGVSRPSLREAIRSLAAKGRLSVRHGQGVFVEEDATTEALRWQLDRYGTDLEELFAMREVLEVPAAGWAARHATDEQLGDIRAAFEALVAAAGADPIDWAALQAMDVSFHEAIVRGAGNRFLRRTLGVLNEIMTAGMQTTLRAPGRLQASTEDHRRLLAAIEARSPTQARAAARAHVRAAHATARRVEARAVAAAGPPGDGARAATDDPGAEGRG